jgi:hypothetical protein
MNPWEKLVKLEMKAGGSSKRKGQQMNGEKIIRGSIHGIIAGTISTMVIDIVAMIMLAPVGISLWSFFALIGRCLLTLIGPNAFDPAWLGITLHYSIGILTGVIISLLTQMYHKLRFKSYRKAVLFCLIIAEVEGNSLFYLMSVIMNIPQSEIWFMYGLCVLFHLIWGTCLGLIISYFQQHKAWPDQKGISAPSLTKATR